MSEQSHEIVVNGGPPMPQEFCTNPDCQRELTGKREHCMNAQKQLFCSPKCRDEHAATQAPNTT